MKAVRYVLVPLVLALTATTTAMSASASAARVTLTNADNGRAVSVRAGEEVHVRLTGTRGQGVTWTWSEPKAGSPGTLERIGGSLSPNGDATAVFRVTGPGLSDITAVRRCHPAPGSQCPQVVQPWKVTVEVL
ncbi:hypothetical protein [Amycolatopsis alba]|uniref:Proteinase inhibitor I42 chagasin domain-containing protein n=1 Tax=Amycolatopsis alba DSM 44262 TaxID=1125972 RepID=A0A229S313_AMYAL|nr:hypothetical protein [Amycolatopsis alba]OXM53109.1 hypothetical protein CFP75_07910 [Amycolatopsis alba DSM 44262]